MRNKALKGEKQKTHVTSENDPKYQNAKRKERNTENSWSALEIQPGEIGKNLRFHQKGKRNAKKQNKYHHIGPKRKRNHKANQNPHKNPEEKPQKTQQKHGKQQETEPTGQTPKIRKKKRKKNKNEKKIKTETKQRQKSLYPV